MGGRITGLQFQKRTAERVNVYLDGKFAFGLSALQAARLHMGQYLDDAEVARLTALDAEQQAYERAVRFLGHRPRSQAEVRANLIGAGIDETLIEPVIARLVAAGYLDDGEFARFWVENRAQFRPKGAQALRQELHQKGVDRATIETAVASLDAAADAYEAGRPRAARLAALATSDPAGFRRQLGGFLLRRGFDYGTVREVVERLGREMRDADAPQDETPEDQE